MTKVYETALGTVTTQALADFIRREGPEGTGRVVDVSLEGEDGVFIYTRSAEWCDDSGAGTFRGDSETGAIARFRNQVQAGNGCPTRPGPADGSPCFCPDCMAGRNATVYGDMGPLADRSPAIPSNESRVTVWRNLATVDARPVASLERPRMYGDRGRAAGLFRLSDADGLLVKTWTRVPTVADVRAALVIHGATKEAARREVSQETPDAMEDAAAALDAEAARIEERAARKIAGIGGSAVLWNLAAYRRNRAAAVRKLAGQERAAAWAEEPAAPRARSLSASATPAALKDGYDAPARAAVAAAMAADGLALAPVRRATYWNAREADRYARGVETWSLSERTARAVETSRDLYRNPANPFGSVRYGVGLPEGRATLAWAWPGDRVHVTEEGLAWAKESPEEAAAAFFALATPA